METAEVVIVGGGIVGSSIAWHLTEAGCKNLLVLERESQQGKGSTGKSMGGVRAQFATAVNIRMSLYSIPFYAAFEERLGYPAGYRAQGYLFLATSDAHMAYLRTNCALQKSMGLSTVSLPGQRDISSWYPQLRTDDVVGGSFCTSDGFVDPYSAMIGFMTSATERGAKLWKNAEVAGLELDAAGAIAAVKTTRGTVSTPCVVNAAGVWAADVAALAGISLPVEPLKRMLVPSEPFAEFPHSAPMIIDMTNGFHFRPEALGFLLAWNDPEEHRSFNTDFDASFVEKVLTHAAYRVPCFERLPVNPKRGWAGLYEMTPDHHPVLGAVTEVPGLYLANGFSGHGVMHAPATGKVLADLITTGKTDLIDAGLLSLRRFAENKLIHESAVL